MRNKGTGAWGGWGVWDDAAGDRHGGARPDMNGCSTATGVGDEGNKRNEELRAVHGDGLFGLGTKLAVGLYPDRQ